jgi:protein transport protein SEC31
MHVSTVRPNIFVTGAANAELYICDLNRPDMFFAPGEAVVDATLRGSAVSGVCWNAEVPHILASAPGGKTAYVWDLRQKKTNFKCTDPAGRARASIVQWHPSQPLKLAIGSSDPTYPVVQFWDLRQRCASPLLLFPSPSLSLGFWCSMV